MSRAYLDKFGTLYNKRMIRRQSSDYLNHQEDFEKVKVHYDEDMENEEYINRLQIHEEYINIINKKMDSYLKKHIINYHSSEKYSFRVYEMVRENIQTYKKLLNKGEDIENGMETKMLFIYITQFKKYHNEDFSERFMNKTIEEL